MRHQGQGIPAVHGLQTETTPSVDYTGPLSRDGNVLWMSNFEASTPSIPSMPPRFVTYGFDLFTTNFSKHLIELVQACLADSPADRPSALQVSEYVDRILAIYDSMNGSDPLPFILEEDQNDQVLPDRRQAYTPEESAALLKEIDEVDLQPGFRKSFLPFHF
jgi:serine/threonine protein kinase